MVWYYGTTASSAARRDLLDKIVALATSQHVSAAVLNAAGTGYVAGETLTIPHAGGYLPAIIEILTVGGSGEILTFAIRAGGAYANRVASVVVNAGGSGYTTGHVVRLTTGTATQQCKLLVTAAAGAVTSAAVFETGGAYSVAPDATASASNSDIGVGSGTGATFDVTMTGLIGTTGAAASGGSGSGATFDLTLTATGWTALVDRNDYSFNSVTDEKEVILQGDAGSADDPLVGFRTYTTLLGDTRYGIMIAGMDSYNPLLAFGSQPNVSPSTPDSNAAPCLLMFDNAQSYWISINGRRIVAEVKAVGASITSYVGMYAGLMKPFGTQTESPYPMALAATSKSYQRKPDAGGFFVSSLTEFFSDTTALAGGLMRRQSDGAWLTICNVANGTLQQSSAFPQCYPLGNIPFASGGTGVDRINADGQLAFVLNGTGAALANGATPTQAIMPTIGDGEILRVPVGLAMHNSTGDNNSETLLRGEFEGVYWIPGTKADGSIVSSEDTLTDPVTGDRFRIFQNAHRTERYSFFCIQEA